MPLRASLDGQDILAFNCDEEAWKKLKKCSLTMPCCRLRAIPKTSKLGNYFFAHHRRGSCTSAPEGPEHIYLKSLIAKLAIANGYDVTTEKSGETPDGEKWIADVFRQKDKVKLAIEVQWSHQTNAGFVRKQNKYAASGVRAACILKLSGNKLYRNNELPYDQATPVFGIKYRPNTKDLFVPQFDKSIEDFVDGMLSGKLNWGPILGEKLYCEIIFDNIQCWKCNKITGFISGIMIRDLFYNKISYEPFSSQEVSIFVTQNINNLQLAGLGIG